MAAHDNAEFANDVAHTVLNVLFGRKTDSFDIDKLNFLAAAFDSSSYASIYMQKAKRCKDAFDLLTYAQSQTELSGLNLEFGVFSGRSINHMAATSPERTFYGFDSFEGLPEDWRPGLGKGMFGLEKLPPVASNVQLIQGWFDHSIPKFLDGHGENAAFIHVDCDLYSSTKSIFHLLRDRIVPGTVIVFDEYFNYPEWRQHEFRAFQEFADYYRHAYRYIGLVPNHQQVAIVIES